MLRATAGCGVGVDDAGIAPALRCRMFENSSMKVSSWIAMRSMSRAKRLYAMTAGIAANRPIAVATSASAMPGATGRERHLLQVRQADERMHDPHTVPNRPMYGDTEPTDARNDRCDSIASISRWKLARIARRAPSSRPLAFGDAALAQLEELAHAGREDALHRRRVGALRRIAVQLVQVAAGPELALELLVHRAHSLQAEQLAEDHGPARERADHQAGHHDLHDEARLHDEGQYREVLVH
jgi:hypothetical protein